MDLSKRRGGGQDQKRRPLEYSRWEVIHHFKCKVHHFKGKNPSIVMQNSSSNIQISSLLDRLFQFLCDLVEDEVDEDAKDKDLPDEEVSESDFRGELFWCFWRWRLLALVLMARCSDWPLHCAHSFLVELWWT